MALWKNFLLYVSDTKLSFYFEFRFFFFQSIRRAHVDVRPAEIFYSEGELHEANINRSPTSYLANPEEEREK